MVLCKALDGAFCQGLILFNALSLRRVLHDDSLVMPFQRVYGENAEQRTSRTVATQADPYCNRTNSTVATAAPSPLPAIICAGV